MKQNSILKGTMILTLAGLITRALGFLYKIYLSKMMTAEHLGLYYLVFPIYGICFTVYASGIQTAISQLTAHQKNKRKVLCIGLSLSVCIALFLSIFIYHYSVEISTHFLMEPELASSLRILALVFPFCGITACVNGYYYGQKKTAIPAISQLLEQIVRIVSVYFIAAFLGQGDYKVTCELAVFGVVFGEIAANLLSLISFCPILHQSLKKTSFDKRFHPQNTETHNLLFKKLIKLAVPLTANRLLINILHSIESVLIPYMLQKHGLDNETALSVYGVLNGMAIPFILFPSTITNSLGVLLLPTVAEAQSTGNQTQIEKTVTITTKYSLILGIMSTGIFFLFGPSCGKIFFHNEAAGHFLFILSWLCPFLYLSNTLTSILNGLGLTHLTFFNSITGLSIRILFTLYIIPKQGIHGYLIGLLISQLAMALLDVIALKKYVRLTFDAFDWIVKPGITVALLVFVSSHIYNRLQTTLTISPLLLLFISGVLFCLIFIGFAYVLGFFPKKKNR